MTSSSPPLVHLDYYKMSATDIMVTETHLAANYLGRLNRPNLLIPTATPTLSEAYQVVRLYVGGPSRPGDHDGELVLEHRHISSDKRVYGILFLKRGDVNTANPTLDALWSGSRIEFGLFHEPLGIVPSVRQPLHHGDELLVFDQVILPIGHSLPSTFKPIDVMALSQSRALTLPWGSITPVPPPSLMPPPPTRVIEGMDGGNDGHDLLTPDILSYYNQIDASGDMYVCEIMPVDGESSQMVSIPIGSAGYQSLVGAGFANQMVNYIFMFLWVLLVFYVAGPVYVMAKGAKHEGFLFQLRESPFFLKYWFPRITYFDIGVFVVLLAMDMVLFGIGFGSKSSLMQLAAVYMLVAIFLGMASVRYAMAVTTTTASTAEPKAP